MLPPGLLGPEMQIQEDLTFGFDLGIASCGWAVIRGGDGAGEIVALGTWMFDAPETAKERTPTNQLRRQARGMRRVLKRRRQRMNAIRTLFKAHGLIESDGKGALRVARLDPWHLRAQGLDRKLTGQELALALGHIAKHRGFKSNSKRDRGANAAKDSSDMLKAIAETRDKIATWRTVGEMFARSEEYAHRKRNRDGEYSRSILRDDQEREVRLILDCQRRAGSALATSELEQAFIDAAFFQRPLADSEDMVGPCPFEPTERRAAKHCYSFELFRMLARATTLRIRSGRDERALAKDEIERVEAAFGAHKSFTYRALRNLLGLSPAESFAGVKAADEKQDFVARSGAAAEGFATIRDVVRERTSELAWIDLLNRPELLDRAAFVLAFREDIGSIRQGLEEIDLDDALVLALMAGVELGEFGAFKGAAHISAKAARNMLPHLRAGLGYAEAAKAAGYDHSARQQTDLDNLGNPVARKALGEALKQAKALIQAFGLPGKIHVELARDVGKSKDERDDISRGIERRSKERDRLREEFEGVAGRPSVNAEDLMRYELWKEQGGFCLYSNRAIHPDMIFAGDRTVEVDHILPWSRFGDDSFVNKTLCFAAANQDKKGRTPFEWLGQDAARWAEFVSAVEGNKAMKGRKKRNYTLKSAAEVEEKFRSRNLNDTRYASRLLADELAKQYPATGQRRVFARPGALTDRLRRAWGIQDLKKDEDGARRADDRHHALDALICAAMSESALQKLTAAFKASEDRGARRDFAGFDPPWPGFVEDARRKLREAFVARSERRRARGEAHAATVRQIAERDEVELVFERKNVDGLTLADLGRIKDPDRNAAVVAALRNWIDAGKPAGAPPRSPKGDAISKVRLKTNKKVDVLIRDGATDRGDMVRVDVFRERDRKGGWKYFLVPIYPHQVADAKCWPTPPNKAVKAHKPESDWTTMTATHEFLWSLYSRSYVVLETAGGVSLDGYFAGLDRDGGQISIASHRSKTLVHGRIGTKTLKAFEKYAVDRLGRRFLIERETRTWRGVACT